MIEATCLAGLDAVRHGFFTRRGGVSEGVYASLNCGAGSRDRPEDVRENRARVLAALGAEPGRLAAPYQVHSAQAVVALQPWPRGEAPKADAVVTDRRGLAVAVLTADCAPVLFCDPQAGVVAAAHAGWKGALAGVLEATVAAMEGLGARPGRITAALGPAIAQAAYEVGEEFALRFLAADGANERYFARPQAAGLPRFDLPAFAADRLTAAGVGRVESLGICTYGDESRFYSYRRATHRREPDYGRQISAILLA